MAVPVSGRLTAARLVRAASRLIPRAEAEFLLEHLLDCRRHELYEGEDPVPARIRRRYAALVGGAADGAPVQYLVHSAPFLDFELYVDRRVLIPRPETEELVLRTAARLQSAMRGLQSVIVLDFGTGSGCIAIALARMFPRARVVAADASGEALRVCRRNAKALGVGGRVRLVKAADFDHPELRRLSGSIDLLISNPPYIPTRRLARLDPRVRNHEPIVALDGGPKGTNIVAMLLRRGPEMLAPNGFLALEVDATHPRMLKPLAPAAEFECDLASRPRYLFWHADAPCVRTRSAGNRRTAHRVRLPRTRCPLVGRAEAR